MKLTNPGTRLAPRAEKNPVVETMLSHGLKYITDTMDTKDTLVKCLNKQNILPLLPTHFHGAVTTLSETKVPREEQWLSDSQKIIPSSP